MPPVITDYLNKRRVGRHGTNDHLNIIGSMVETRNIVKLQSYQFSLKKGFQNEYMAIDSSGRHILVGSTEEEDNHDERGRNVVRLFKTQPICKTKLPKKGQVDEYVIGRSGALNRLQWIPHGDTCYSINTLDGLTVVDTSQQVASFQWTIADETHWSDWHRRDVNLVAACGEKGVYFIDTRQEASSVPSIAMTDNFTEAPTCCIWDSLSEFNLLVSEANCYVSIYDKRQLSMPVDKRRDVPDYNQEYDHLSRLQMTPNGRYLFGHNRESGRLYQWRYSPSDGKFHYVRFYSDLECIDGPRCRKCYRTPEASFQYHLTDTHVFIPQGKPRDVGYRELTFIGVFNIETGELVNSFKSRDDEDEYENYRDFYDSETDSDDENTFGEDRAERRYRRRYRRIPAYFFVDIVVGSNDLSNNQKLYGLRTLGFPIMYEINVWSISFKNKRNQDSKDADDS